MKRARNIAALAQRPGMHLIPCDPFEFQEQMCRLGFVRLSPYDGANNRHLYHTDIPPEKIPGCVDRLIAGICGDLGITLPRAALFGGRGEIPWDDVQ